MLCIWALVASRSLRVVATSVLTPPTSVLTLATSLETAPIFCSEALLLLRQLGGLGVLRLLRRKDDLGAGVDLLLGGADVLAEGIGGGAQAGIGGVEAIGQVNVLLVGCGKTLVGCGDAVLQAVAPTQRAYAQQSCNDDRCDECPRGGPLGYDDWFCIAHELLPLAVAS